MYLHPYVYDVLRRSAGAVLGNRVYPIASPAGTALPFATYRVDSSRAVGSKDGDMADVAVQVAIVGKSLSDLHKLADDVVMVMEKDGEVAQRYGLVWPRWQSTEELYDMSVDGYVLTITINYKMQR